MKKTTLIQVTVALAAVLALASAGATDVTPAETKTIAQEGFIYGFPMVMNYGAMNEYFIDKSSSQYKCGFKQIYNTDQVYTPKDTAWSHPTATHLTRSSAPICGPSRS